MAPSPEDVDRRSWVTLTRIRPVSDPSGRANGSPPGEVEIYRAITPGRFRSLANGVFHADAPSLELDFAPAKTRLVRLKIYSIAGNSNHLTLSSVQLY